MELTESIIELVWDPDGSRTTLVPFGSPMWDEVTISGQRSQSVTSLVRSDSARVTSRGNELNRITFSISREKPSVRDAMLNRFKSMSTVPAGTADLLVKFDSGKKYRIKRSSIESWETSQVENLTRESLTITGGKMIDDVGTYAPGPVWGES